MEFHRRSIRLPEYDYSSCGGYFVTICAQDRELYFENHNVKQMISTKWQELKNKFYNIDLEEYVIMPNHLHGIIIIGNDIVGADLCVRPTNTNKTNIHPAPNKGAHAGAPLQNPTLSKIIQWFKTKTKNWTWFAGKLWQRNYYEHIIRNQKSLNKIRDYIQNNPINWEFDRNNPKNLKIKN